MLCGYRGEFDSAAAYAEALIRAGAELGGFLGGCGYMISGHVATAAGDVAAAEDATRLGGRSSVFTRWHV